MDRYWEATLDDGSVAVEGSCKWSDIEGRVVNLCLHIEGRTYHLPQVNDASYFQAKTVSVGFTGGNPVIDSRYIGFRHSNQEYCFRVNENSLHCQLEISGLK